MADIRIIIDNHNPIKACLYETNCAKKIYELLPIESIINEWGDEFYFSIPLTFPLDDTATKKVKVGDIGYWPPGNALCIFFGPTPISNTDEPIPASEVNIVGRVLDNVETLKSLKGSKKIIIEKA